jgi:hypothetical protein
VPLLVPKLSAFQRRVDRLARFYRALRILLGGIPQEERVRLDAEIRAVPYVTTRPLKAFAASLEDAIDGIDKDFGIISRPALYVSIVEEAIEAPYDLRFVPKHFIDTRLFKRFENKFDGWSEFPPHTRIGMDAKSILPFAGRDIEFRLLEAALFEDMAMLWNECLTHETDDRGASRAERIPGKRFRSLKRSAARAVFALLEGYINGLSVDVQWAMSTDQLSARALELLTEKTEDGRSRYTRLRDKILQYPKIAMGLEHPPIQDSNIDLTLVLLRERQWRDAIMHPTPRLEDDPSQTREQYFFEIDINELRELIDAAVRLIRTIDDSLNGKYGRVTVWLQGRGPDGRFPESVFY